VLRGFRAASAPRDVYNLTVDGAHEFYANGVLVHNCDALRYLTVNLGGGPDFPILDAPDSSLLTSLGVPPYRDLGGMAERLPPDAVPGWSWDDDGAGDEPRPWIVRMFP
jgi:hypothetical protein